MRKTEMKVLLFYTIILTLKHKQVE